MTEKQKETAINKINGAIDKLIALKCMPIGNDARIATENIIDALNELRCREMD